jgi:Ser/Thr protein kinase RdoA (MazF antagonist)
VITCARSLAAPEAVTELVRHHYGRQIHGSVLLRSLVNDVYQVRAPDRRYVLKLYGAGPEHWSIGEVVWEQELATHLASSGVEVAAVVPLTDGRLAGEVAAPEGPRPFALTEFVEGAKPRPPYDDELYRDFGRLTARFHAAGDTFSGSRRRRPIDLQMTLEEPLTLVPAQLAGRPDDARLVRELGAEARRRMAEFASRGLAWGIRHGDVTLDNIHRTARGLVLHDFDCAGPGWLVADLAGVRGTEHWDAFRAGYRQIRELPEVELAALPWLGVIELIWNLRFHLVDRPAFHGTESIGDGWVDRELASLRQAARTLR